MLKQTLTALCFGLISLIAATSPSWAGMGLPQRLVLLEEKIQAESTNVQLYLRRALILSDMGEFKRAFADLDTAAQLGPIEQTYFARGMLFYRLGQFDTAVSFFDQYLNKYPNQSDALLFRARVLRDAEQHEQALNDYLSYLKVAPRAEPGAYLAATQLMMTLIEQGSTKYDHDAILAMLDLRIAQLGKAPQLQRYAIDVAQQACRSDQAIERLNQLPSQSQKAPQWHLQLVEQHLLRQDAQQAMKHLQDAGDVLQKKRPSAFKAKQSHRYRYLKQLLDTTPQDAASFDLIHQAFYPDRAHTHPHEAHASDRAIHHQHNHSHDADQGHTHSPLADLQQPKKANPSYKPAWAEPVQTFHQCAMRQWAASTATPKTQQHKAHQH